MARERPEQHYVGRTGWLRAAVLGANDGLVSIASLIIGVAASSAAWGEVVIAGAAGLVAGAMSMAAGEYVSVSSQADVEQADLARERREHLKDSNAEHKELVQIYIQRGLTPETAQAVASQLAAKDPVAAHARDELGILEMTSARPVQAAWASATAFTLGAAAPLFVFLIAPDRIAVPLVAASSLLFLAILGALGAMAGGAAVWRGTTRVLVWGHSRWRSRPALGTWWAAQSERRIKFDMGKPESTTFVLSQHPTRLTTMGRP